jgi:chromate transport protein ChrA
MSLAEFESATAPAVEPWTPRQLLVYILKLFTILPAPYSRRISKNRSIKAFVDGVTAAATGAIAGATFVLGKRALFDPPTVLLFAVTLVLLVRFKELPEPVLIRAAGTAGLARFFGLGVTLDAPR